MRPSQLISDMETIGVIELHDILLLARLETETLASLLYCISALELYCQKEDMVFSKSHMLEVRLVL